MHVERITGERSLSVYVSVHVCVWEKLSTYTHSERDYTHIDTCVFIEPRRCTCVWGGEREDDWKRVWALLWCLPSGLWVDVYREQGRVMDVNSVWIYAYIDVYREYCVSAFTSMDVYLQCYILGGLCVNSLTLPVCVYVHIYSCAYKEVLRESRMRAGLSLPSQSMCVHCASIHVCVYRGTMVCMLEQHMPSAPSFSHTLWK